MLRKFLAVTYGAALLAGCATTQQDDAGDLDTMLANMLAGNSAVQGADLDAALKQADSYPLGSAENPVRASMPAGQRAYLDRLRCAAGDAPRYERAGSMGFGPYGNIVDLYVLECQDGSSHDVTMDMYHQGYVETRPVPGFSVLN